MIAVAILPLVLMQSVPPQTARIEGQVLNAVTGDPLKKATIRLNGSSGFFGAEGGQPVAYGATSGEGGKFVIEGIPPGTYGLWATRTGFVEGSYGARAPGAPSPLKLGPGQEMKDVVVKLVPQAMIFGRVVDEDGEPFPNASIQLRRWTYSGGRKQLRQISGGGSQADGSFVIGGLQAGRYFLSAEPQGEMAFGVVQRSAKEFGPGHEALVTTYFPSALDSDAAAPLELTAGSEMRGVEIRLRKSRTYELRGNVAIQSIVGTPEEMSLMLQKKGASDFPSFNGNTMAQVPSKSMAFQFKNVLPGTYIIRTQDAMVAMRNSDGDLIGQRDLVGRTEITVGDHDMEGIVFPLGAGAEISGKFIWDGDPPPSSPAAPSDEPRTPSVSLSPVQGVDFNTNTAQAKADGTFKMKSIAPDAYHVIVNGNPEVSYIKAIRFGGQDINGKPLDLTSGSGGDLEIVLSPNGAEVSGGVRDADGQPIRAVTIQVLGDDKMAGGGFTDQDGKFKVSGIAPGSYRVFAWENSGEGIIYDEGFRKMFESKATPIKLSEKSHENIEVKLISAADMEVELAKIR